MTKEKRLSMELRVARDDADEWRNHAHQASMNLNERELEIRAHREKNIELERQVDVLKKIARLLVDL